MAEQTTVEQKWEIGDVLKIVKTGEVGTVHLVNTEAWTGHFAAFYMLVITDGEMRGWIDEEFLEFVDRPELIPTADPVLEGVENIYERLERVEETVDEIHGQVVEAS